MKSRVGPGNSSSLRVRRRVGGQARPLLVGELTAAGRVQLRPASALVRNGSGQPPGGIAQLAVQEADHRVGDVEAARVGGELGRVGADRDQVQGEVADDLGGRGHLDDVAEDRVGGGVHVLDLLELLAEAERDRLLAQVGELAAGDLVGVDPAGRRGQAGLERGVDPTGRLPVGLQRADRGEVEPGLALGVVGRRDQRRQGGLRGGAGHRGGGRVDRVDAGVDRGEQGGQLAARGVVGVQVDRAGRSARAAR